DSQAIAIVQAGTNTLGPTANTSLFGQSVARPSWTLVIPSGVNAPANKDLNLEQLEDIVLEIAHRALPRREGGSRADIACLGSVGAGLGAQLPPLQHDDQVFGGPPLGAQRETRCCHP